MIPKVIHYCWFGGNPLPASAKKCIASWRKYLPDYEIKEWNESNFDVNIIPYTAEAYKAKKYAFVSDYARLWILYKYGGLYFDTDVEVLKPFDEFEKYDFFLGLEMNRQVGTSVIGATPSHPLIMEFLEFYNKRTFINQDGSLDRTPNTVIISKILKKKGFDLDNIVYTDGKVAIFPQDYFSPINMQTEKMELTDRTYSIHHFTGSWQTPQEKLKFRVKAIIKRIFKA